MSLSEDKILKQMSKGHKSTLKKSIKNKCIFFKYKPGKDDKYFEEFYKIYEQTQERALKNNKQSTMTLKSKSFLYNAINDRNVPLEFFFVLKDNELASGAILARHKNSIIYYVGASVIELNRKYGASNLLIWECILYSKKEGFSFLILEVYHII